MVEAEKIEGKRNKRKLTEKESFTSISDIPSFYTSKGLTKVKSEMEVGERSRFSERELQNFDCVNNRDCEEKR